MVNWRHIPDSPATTDEWDDLLAAFDDATVFQTSAWAAYRAGFGWSAARLAAYGEDSRPQAAVQILYKKLPLGHAVGWAAGSPCGDPGALDDAFFRAAKAALGARKLYLRVRPNASKNEADAKRLSDLDWRTPRKKLGTGLTMVLDPSLSAADMDKNLSKNWRHNLKRSGKYGLMISPWLEPSAEEAAVLYRSMQDYKAIDEQFSPRELEQTFLKLKKHLRILQCRSEAGRLIGLRACLSFGERAWDFLAATDEEGRKTYASYALLWALLGDCRERGIRRYDMGGVDPQGNAGVFNFKKGTGAALFEYLGEWEKSDSSGLKFAVNFKIGRGVRAL